MMAQQGLKTTPEAPEKPENGPEKAPTGAPDAPRAFQDALGSAGRNSRSRGSVLERDSSGFPGPSETSAGNRR